MDVKTTFLNGKIEEEVYIEQPEDFVTHGKNTHVCKLKKTLYGLNRLLESCMPGWMDFSIAWGFPKVQLILTCTLNLFIIMS